MTLMLLMNLDFAGGDSSGAVATSKRLMTMGIGSLLLMLLVRN